MWDDLARLRHGFLADVPKQTLLMKVAEEFGEAVEAYIGATGQNPRKGVCRTVDDIRKELYDVIVTAGIAVLAWTADDQAKTAQGLTDHLKYLTERAGV